MDRTNKYMNRTANDEYRDYFAELVCVLLRFVCSDVFRAVFSTVTFVFSFIFIIGIAGAIELNTVSYAVGIPVLVMMLCALAFIHKIRK